MNVDRSMQRFRTASRELFNTHFRIESPWENDGWSLEARFCRVEAVLFEQLVASPLGLSLAPYGELQTQIRVVLRGGSLAPIMPNRETDSGYWDAKPNEVTADAELSFIRFFDWDLLDVRDNQVCSR